MRRNLNWFENIFLLLKTKNVNSSTGIINQVLYHWPSEVEIIKTGQKKRNNPISEFICLKNLIHLTKKSNNMQNVASFEQVQSISTSAVPFHSIKNIIQIVVIIVVICVSAYRFVGNLMQYRLKHQIELPTKPQMHHKLLNRCGLKRYGFMCCHFNNKKNNCWRCVKYFFGSTTRTTTATMGTMRLNSSVIMSGKCRNLWYLLLLFNLLFAFHLHFTLSTSTREKKIDPNFSIAQQTAILTI